MAKDFEWHYDAAGAVFLKSDGIASACEEAAARMTKATGMEYKADVRMGKKRVRAMARGNLNGTTVKKSKRHRNNGGTPLERDPETGWPICPTCGEAHAHCRHLRRKKKKG